ncbi:MAG: hypothetical protein JWN40_2278 [Phycisphaerales bacterium]|nr:hypothetical protein [Phycisphaerales bacterium]
MLFRPGAKRRTARISARISRNRDRIVELESLEERRLLATFVVTSNGDIPILMGTTLRQAILMANLLPDADTITFNIAGTPTIHPLTALPPVTGPTTIDGTSQPGVFIEGTGTLPDLITGNTDGLRLTGGDITLRGLAIGGFSAAGAAGVRVSGNNNLLAGNRIGIDPTGAPDGNFQGVVVEAATNTRIGGSTLADRNVISGNFLNGLLFNGAGSGNVVAGNYIGVNAPGNAPLANQLSGINVQPLSGSESSDLLIGGTSAGARNVISGNNVNGITISNVSGVRIQGNYIGTDAAGTAAIQNDANGVSIEGSAGATIIGGIGAPGRNVISGNSGDGVRIDSTGSGNVVQGNFIGTDSNGAAALPNTANGVNVLSGAVLIGGSTAGAGNVISANEGNGVVLGSSGSSVQFNFIGLAADGVSALGNAGDGIYIDGSDNSIGTPATGNSIAYNGGTGITVALSLLDVRNAIRGDNIYLNGRLGIDLGDDGVTMNDPQDPDVGPNNFQNFPVLTSVTLSGSTATISGTLNSTPLSQFVIDFFASQIWDTTTYGEGQKYLGSTTVTTDAAGNATFTATVSGVPAGFNYFAATATDASGNTSEFSYDPTPGASPTSPGAPTAPAKQSKDKSDVKSFLRS